MSETILKSELLNRLFDRKDITREEAYQVYQEAEKNPHELYKAAEALRDRNKGRTITYSRKIFFNLINLCRDTCSYCTYKAEPNDSKISMMTKQDVSRLIEVGQRYNCTEALFVTGEKPEQKYPEARRWLERNGFGSTAEYLVHASEMALDGGLFPHTNAGNLTKSEMSQLKKTNVSLGLMLESSSERLSAKGMPHEFAPSKNPRARIRILENTGELSIPVTTGLLIGIGESPFELIDSIFTIKSIHHRYGNIQEIILQNFQPKPLTRMQDVPSPEERYFKNLVALARLILPEMNIQIPPNLSPRSYSEFLKTGINDWGGISPVTPDYVNPEFAWPSIESVREHCQKSGFMLRTRFPVYPEFFHMVEPNLKSKIEEKADEMGFFWKEY
ncbi:MAG TPA: 7,8-didemethyl-8-hydroxy-5-deazariboflavin synthase subunit CofG [Candidatus Nitrosotalea sp.]|nr:7,8-didemethyl-8-hydroxy-5-deazariboflavin synthase subunit CofG [Candidatus Nitrosotalea sp.]